MKRQSWVPSDSMDHSVSQVLSCVVFYPYFAGRQTPYSVSRLFLPLLNMDFMVCHFNQSLSQKFLPLSHCTLVHPHGQRLTLGPHIGHCVMRVGAVKAQWAVVLTQGQGVATCWTDKRITQLSRR